MCKEYQTLYICEIPVEESEPMTVLAKIDPNDVVVKTAVAVWVEATAATDLARHSDIQREKRRFIKAFFNFVKIGPGEVTPQDVQAWLREMPSRWGGRVTRAAPSRWRAAARAVFDTSP
jgi:hypothetical protein